MQLTNPTSKQRPASMAPVAIGTEIIPDATKPAKATESQEKSSAAKPLTKAEQIAQADAQKVTQLEAINTQLTTLNASLVSKRVEVSSANDQVAALKKAMAEAVTKSEVALEKLKTAKQSEIDLAETAVTVHQAELTGLSKQIDDLEQQATDIRSSKSWAYFLTGGYIGAVPADTPEAVASEATVAVAKKEPEGLKV